MRAIRVHSFGGPEVLKLEDVPTPAPEAGQVLVRIKAIGVNPVETYIRAGQRGPKDFPYIPGSDGAGVIEAIGGGVLGWSVGERVYLAGSLSGSYAEFSVCAADQIYTLPEQLTFSQGAAINVPYATAYRALFQRGRAQPGEKVFIHGASGGVGIAAVQLARAHGLTVVGTAGTPRGRELALKEGAHVVLDHTASHYLLEAAAFTKNQGFNLIIEMLANVNLARDLSIIGYGGRIIVVGNRGSVEIDPRQAMSQDASIIGMVLHNTPASERSAIHAALGAGFENGTLRPIVGRELPLHEASRAHELVYEPGAYGKIVLVP